MSEVRDAFQQHLTEIQERIETYGDRDLELEAELRNVLDAFGSTGKQFFTLLEAVLDLGSRVGLTKSQMLSEMAVHLYDGDAPRVHDRFFRPQVPLPDGLTAEHLRRAMNLTQKRIFRVNLSLVESTGAPLTAYIQSNNYSGIVSNMLTDALGQSSPFRPFDDQAYPDLKDDRGVGVEVKAANRAGKGAESHNGHGGWHLIAGFHTDEETGAVRFVHIQLAQLEAYNTEKDKQGRPFDWTYYGSSRDEETGSQRTETYATTLRGTTKLRNGTVYLDTDAVDSWTRWQVDDSVALPPHALLYFKRLDDDARVPSPKTGNLVKWASVRTILNKRDPLWPLYDRDELRSEMGLPEELIDFIRPPQGGT